jgi:tetratricopeptide (TPR) repeat protein
MQYQEYLQQVQQVSQLIQEARFKEAVAALYQLILSDISEIDKADMCANLAVVYDRMGNSDEAMVWYEKGVSVEQNYCRFDVIEKKAQYLSQLGSNDQAVTIYESLMQQPFVSEGDKERMRKTIQGFLGKAMRGRQ